MVYLSLYRKYRPQTFDEILGQGHVSSTLTNAITEDRVAHAYLFTGPRGTGKTSTARILAKALNCVKGPTPSPCGVCESCRSIMDGSSMDVIEMDAASHSKVDETREILAGVPLASAGGKKKVYVIDEVHMLSTQAFNALLKTLEEPPSHVVFILATTEAHKVLPTIVSRTQRFDFRRVPADILEQHLSHIAKLESIDVEAEALALVARHADGGVRDALSALDQLSSLGGHVTELDVDRMLGDRHEDSFFEVFDSIASSDVGAIFLTLHALVSQGADPRQLALGALAHARSLLLLRTAPDAEGLLDVADEELPKLQLQAESFTPASLLGTMDLLAKALTEMRNAPNHRLLLEVALVRAADPETDPSALGLLGRLERLERRMGIEEAAPQAAQVQSRAKPAPQTKSQARPASGPAAKPTPAAAPPASAPRPKSSPQKRAPAPAAETPAAETPSVTEDAPRAAEVAAPAATTSSAGTAGVGLAHIKDAWPATLQELGKRSKRIQAFLNPSRPLRYDGEVLVVEVQSPFHETTMSEDRHRDTLADALFASLGVRPSLTFAARGSEVSAGVEDTASESAGTSPKPAASEVAEIADYETAVPVEQSHDPIELIKKGLGAEVVEERT
jgi:DNA polymerase-3 subunit gamma/tau